jgi:hypothetical protein
LCNGDRFKYNEEQTIEEVFSPRFGYDAMPQEIKEGIEKCKYDWDYHGKYVKSFEKYDVDHGYLNNFFMMKPSGKWIFRTRDEQDYLSDEDGFIKPYVEQKNFQKYKLVQGYKMYKGDEDIWVNEGKFFDRIDNRTPITRRELFEKFVTKYETIFHWLCVKFSKRNKFWKLLENDYKDNVFHSCFEARFEEIIDQCTCSTRKFWKNQMTMSSRKKRTELFESDIFRSRRCWNC